MSVVMVRFYYSSCQDLALISLCLDDDSCLDQRPRHGLVSGAIFRKEPAIHVCAVLLRGRQGTLLAD